MLGDINKQALPRSLLRNYIENLGIRKGESVKISVCDGGHDNLIFVFFSFHSNNIKGL